jgi:hypothetical protein
MAGLFQRLTGGSQKEAAAPSICPACRVPAVRRSYSSVFGFRLRRIETTA